MSDQITRRDFNVQSALALLAGVTITVTGCGGSSSPAPTTPTPPPAAGAGDASGAVADNHGHVAVITAAQLSARNDLVLTITGSADHPHTVALTGAEITQIAARARVSKSSSVDGGHIHTVTFN